MSELVGSSGARTFGGGAEPYQAFMGRYALRLATSFADFAEIMPGQRVLDVGCGPGALTGVAVRRTGAKRVCAIDPSPSFVESCRRTHPGVEVRQASAELIPFEDDGFDRAAAQLVLHFVGHPAAAVSEMSRVVRPGGVVAACVWDFDGGMQLLRTFWDAALSVDADAPDEARTMRFGRAGEISQLFRDSGLVDISETTLESSASYADFAELWQSLLGGVGPAGAYLQSQPTEQRSAIREAMVAILGRPTGRITLTALARAARGHRP